MRKVYYYEGVMVTGGLSRVLLGWAKVALGVR
jgi:hypothetical protein